MIEAIYKEEERKGDKGERLSGEMKRAKEALKKSSQRGKACNLTQGPEPVSLFFLSQTWINSHSSVIMQKKISL